MKNTNKFVRTISHNSPWGDAGVKFTPETSGSTGAGAVDTGDAGGGNSGKFDWNGLTTGITGVINNVLDIFKPQPETNNTTNYYVPEKDNTMLYVGIGGVVLVVILIVIAIKK